MKRGMQTLIYIWGMSTLDLTLGGEGWMTRCPDLESRMSVIWGADPSLCGKSWQPVWSSPFEENQCSCSLQKTWWTRSNKGKSRDCLDWKRKISKENRLGTWNCLGPLRPQHKTELSVAFVSIDLLCSTEKNKARMKTGNTNKTPGTKLLRSGKLSTKNQLPESGQG